MARKHINFGTTKRMKKYGKQRTFRTIAGDKCQEQVLFYFYKYEGFIYCEVPMQIDDIDDGIENWDRVCYGCENEENYRNCKSMPLKDFGPFLDTGQTW